MPGSVGLEPHAEIVPEVVSSVHSPVWIMDLHDWDPDIEQGGTCAGTVAPQGSSPTTGAGTTSRLPAAPALAGCLPRFGFQRLGLGEQHAASDVLDQFTLG